MSREQERGNTTENEEIENEYTDDSALYKFLRGLKKYNKDSAWSEIQRKISEMKIPRFSLISTSPLTEKSPDKDNKLSHNIMNDGERMHTRLEDNRWKLEQVRIASSSETKESMAHFAKKTSPYAQKIHVNARICLYLIVAALILIVQMVIV